MLADVKEWLREEPRQALALGISAVALLLSFLEVVPGPVDPAWLAVLLCGVPIIKEGAEGLFTRFDIKADVLVSLALLASVIIGEIFAAGEVAFIMQLGALLEEAGLACGVGDEGGFAPNLKNHDEAFSYIVKAIEEAGYIPGSEVALAIDAAASEFYQDGKYVLKGENKTFNNAEMAQWLAEFTSKYPLISIEDGMAESDWDGWGMLTASLGERTQLVGDDVFVTNPSILAEGIAEGVANSILIKLNQIGTVTETLDTIEMAKEAAYTTVVSHRSGETEDSFIADLAVGVNAGQIKTGSLCRSERMAKYNQLLRIEEELGDGAEFFGPMLAEYYALDESED